MALPKFVPSIAPDIERTIQAKLLEIEARNSVRILFAIESGSRAWGFPSPDSDYDVRFVYVHDPDWYLSIRPGRDVIELPIEGDWDINGWDLRKALGLLVKPNPVLLEWLSSPIKYRWDDDVCNRLVEFADKTTYGAACLHHYRSTGLKQWAKHVGDNADVSLKKYFYILRPALAISWIRQKQGIAPPMNLHSLVEGQSLPAGLTDHITRLLELKSQAKEIGRGERIPIVDRFIHEQLDWVGTSNETATKSKLLDEADALLRTIVKGAT
jgi:hypothetical protein